MNGVADILAARQLIAIPAVGLMKHTYPGYWCYITPTLRDVEAVYATGAEIVAVDACKLPKPGNVSGFSQLQYGMSAERG
jgi:N-acylglucosamine-6-phosphate 2-epimerase